MFLLLSCNMKKINIFLINVLLVLVFTSFIGFSYDLEDFEVENEMEFFKKYGSEWEISRKYIRVAGVVYIDNISNRVGNADVEVICDDSVKTTKTFDNGIYFVRFKQNECNTGDKLIVNAYSGDMYGIVETEINDKLLEKITKLNIVNVPLVPEFGVVSGFLAIFGSIASMLWIRRPRI